MKTKLIIMLVLMVKLVFAQEKKPVLGTDYKKYVREMDAYFETHSKGKGSGYKQFMRFQYEMGPKVGHEGIIKNFPALNLAAYKSQKAKIPKNAKLKYTHGLWEDLGPNDYSGSDSYSNNALARVNCVAFHPTDINTLWVGTPAGGIWKTINHGGTWTCISNDFASLGVSDIVVDSANPNIIYILTGDCDSGQTTSIGILKTTDGGLTWKETGLKFDVSQYVLGYALRMHPTDHNILLAATSVGIFRSMDGGVVWNNQLMVKTWDIEFKPGAPNIVYAATVFGILKSTTTGNAYSNANTNFPTDPAAAVNPKTWERLSLAVSPSAPDNIYVLCGGVPASGTFSGMYKSTDSGASWTLKSASPNILGSDTGGGGSNNQASYDLALDVNPTNDSQIFVGAINCWKSDGNGNPGTWSRETNWQRVVGAVDPFVHADFHTVKFRNQRVYACNDGGIYYSDDYGHSWGDISSGIGATQFYNIEIDGSGYIGGTQDNGTNEANFGNFQMHNIAGGDGFGAIWNASNHGIKYLTSQDHIIRRQVDSFGNGVNIFINTGSGLGQFWYCTLKNATNNPGILWAIQHKSHLIRGNQENDISFATWNWYDTGNHTLGAGVLKGYSQGVDNPGIMYAAHEGNLLKNTNAYAAPSPWVVLPSPEPGLYFEDILTDPTNSQRVWIVCGGYQVGKKVYRSLNGGTSWTNISGTLPNIPVNTIALLPGGGDNLYIGTSIGVYHRSGTMTDWAYFSNGLPNVPVQDIKLSSTHVYAGTFGRGIWRSELYTFCPEYLTLTPANETITNIYAPGTQVHSADVTLTSTRQYSGSVGTNIYYNAPQFVELKTGFEIKKEAFLEVKNKGCPN
jgi:hypothetical protein